MSRPPARSQDIKKGQSLGLTLAPGVELVEADVLKPDQLRKALAGCQAVISTTGYVGFNLAGKDCTDLSCFSVSGLDFMMVSI